MTAADRRPSAVAARLIIGGALPAIAGSESFPSSVIGVSGRQMRDDERRAAGLEQPGRTFLFAAEGAEVMLDLSGANAAAWFSGADFDSAIDHFDSELHRAYPVARRTDDRAVADNPATRARAYRILFENGRRAVIELLYALPSATGAERSFTARATALQPPAGRR